MPATAFARLRRRIAQLLNVAEEHKIVVYQGNLAAAEIADLNGRKTRLPTPGRTLCWRCNSDPRGMGMAPRGEVGAVAAQLSLLLGVVPAATACSATSGRNAAMNWERCVAQDPGPDSRAALRTPRPDGAPTPDRAARGPRLPARTGPCDSTASTR
jgi:hypothetical protein